MSSSSAIANEEPDSNAAYATLALALMKKYAITPIPENYAVWFHYATAKNQDLVHEVDNIINNGLVFTAETNLYLYNKYATGHQNQKKLDDAAHDTQKVLVEVLKTINELAGETKNYNKGIDQYIEEIDEEFKDSGVKEIVRELISKTLTLKQSGEKINQKLEKSTQEIHNLKKDLHQVTAEAQRDFLTGLFNRKTFEKQIDEQMAAARETNTDLCLLMIDIDHFKQFNDRFGHLLGDEVLKTVARSLTEILKGRDVVARFGGEEFIVSLPETPLDGAMRVADIIRSAIAGKELKRKDTGESFGTITISVGVGRFRAESDTLPTLIKRADDALYQSKHNGRNCVTCETPQ